MAYQRIWQTLAVVMECLRRNKTQAALRWLNGISPHALEGVKRAARLDRGPSALDEQLFLESLMACRQELTNANRAGGLVWADKALAAWTRLGRSLNGDVEAAPKRVTKSRRGGRRALRIHDSSPPGSVAVQLNCNQALSPDDARACGFNQPTSL